MFGMVLWITESVVGHRCSLLVTIEHGDPLPINHPDWCSSSMGNRTFPEVLYIQSMTWSLAVVLKNSKDLSQPFTKKKNERNKSNVDHGRIVRDLLRL